MTLRDLVARHRVIISAGSGGVGKTTVAASIALWGALEGRRTAVLTIDPARRLATSLGLESLGHELREIPEALFRAQGLAPRAPLAAMMLDQKGAWDALVDRYAPPDARTRILANPFYQHLSQTFAGSQEYMAIDQRVPGTLLVQHHRRQAADGREALITEELGGDLVRRAAERLQPE